MIYVDVRIGRRGARYAIRRHDLTAFSIRNIGDIFRILIKKELTRIMKLRKKNDR